MYDYRKLRGRIREKFGSEKKFAEALGISKVAVSNKFNKKDGGLSQETISKWSELLEITPEEIGIYFFTPKSSESGTW